MTLDEFFAGYAESRAIFQSVGDAIAGCGAAELRVTKSQIAFYRRRAFAWAWMPGLYLHGNCAPLVLTLSLRYRDSSPRWKEIIEPRPGRFTHHLELRSPSDIDDAVRSWLLEAWLAAA
jgi:hypothetical protein